MHCFLLTLLSLLNFTVFTGGRLITCVCTTTHCQEQQTRTCNTTSMCFSQYLDRRDGSDPVVKGCITSKTPLLCENRRPAVHHASWPVLLCCNKNMCNLDVEPTPAGSKNEVTGKGSDITPAPSGDGVSPGIKEVVVTADDSNGRPSDSQHSLSSVYIVILVAGLLCLFIIGGIATLVLRRQSALYNEELGAVQRNGYLKGHSAEISVSEVHRTSPNILGRTYDNKLVMGT